VTSRLPLFNMAAGSGPTAAGLTGSRPARYPSPLTPAPSDSISSTALRRDTALRRNTVLRRDTALRRDTQSRSTVPPGHGTLCCIDFGIG